MFHEFIVVSKTSGIRHLFTGIGPTREYAENIIREYNLKCDDFDERYELINPETEAAR